jgi:hypothetical protein
VATSLESENHSAVLLVLFSVGLGVVGGGGRTGAEGEEAGEGAVDENEVDSCVATVASATSELVLKKLLISGSENPSDFMLCLTTGSGNIFTIFTNFS